MVKDLKQWGMWHGICTAWRERCEWSARGAIALVCTLLFAAGSLAVRTMASPIRDISAITFCVAPSG